ncbi:MAG: heavy metal-binding domain-containing protein [Chlorobi bacterium]|nr:heavy metal-binding domain-containing protein [Chlorobiota bacterium]
MLSKIIIILFGLSVTACAVPTGLQMSEILGSGREMGTPVGAGIRTSDGTKVYTESFAGSVKVFSTKDAGREYEIIGAVVAESQIMTNNMIMVGIYDGSNITLASQSAIDELRNQAGLLGADAIVDLKLKIFMKMGTSINVSGTAVKFKEVNMETQP